LTIKTILIAVGDMHFNFFNPKNAVATCLLSLKKQLECHGYKVILSNVSKSDEKCDVKKGTIWQRIKLLLKTFFPKLYLTLLDRRRIRDVRSFEEELLAREKPDFILEFLEYGSSIAYRFKERHGIPYIIICDAPLLEKYNDIYGHLSWMYKIFELCEKRSLEHADFILFYSNSVRDFISSKYHIDCKTSIYPTIDWEKMVEIKQTKKNPGNITIAFIGSFLKWHKVDLLVLAFEKLWQKNKNIELLLIGYGQEWESISKLIKGLNCSDSITMTGFVSGEELNELKQVIDIGVMPGSNWYGAPLKIFEYAMLSIPVVGPDSPTVIDLFSDDEILVIDSEHEFDSLYRHLYRLVDSDIERESFGQKLNSSVKSRFNKESHFKAIEVAVNSLNMGG